MTPQWFAHSENQAGQRHPARKHLCCVSRLARNNAVVAPWKDEAALAGLLHDLGKYGDLFPDRLRGKESGLDHWSTGAWVALINFEAIAAALAIQGHHIGLQQGDGKSLRAMDIQHLVENHPLGLRLTDPDYQKLLHRAKEDGLNFRKPSVLAAPGNTFLQRPIASMLDVRLLFSCLADADFIDTEAHFAGGPEGKQYRHPGPDLAPDKAVRALDRFMAEKVRPGSRADNPVIKARNRLWDMMLEASARPRGLFTLTAPTGSGKTLAMLKFALEHACQHDFSRIILVVPYLSIIEQTAAVYRAVFSEFPEHFVLEHHSLAGLGSENPKTKGLDTSERARRLLAENWDAPIIITTNVQLLESLFSNRPGACRKLHNLMNSILIFDEAQTLPQALAVPTLAALSHLTQRYQATVMFATATQPAFDTLHEHVRKLVPSGWEPVDAAPDHATLYHALKRYRVFWPQNGETVNWSDLAGQIREEMQVLCVVNLKKHAVRLLEELEESDDTYHLSTNLCALHRRDVLDRVRERLKQNLSCRLISTQCVEAGVDVDFPVVYRAMAPLDAIAQAAGRCNREGRLHDPDGNPIPGEVRVFEPEPGKGFRDRYPTHAYYQAAEITRSMLIRSGKHDLDLNNPKVFREFYRLLYDLGHPEAQNKELDEAIKRMDFVSVARLYRIIPHDTIQVLVPYDQAAEIFEELYYQEEKEGIDAGWIRRAQHLAVGVYRPGRGHPAWEVLAPARLRFGRRDAVSDEWFILQDHGTAMYDNIQGLQLPQSNQILIA